MNKLEAKNLVFNTFEKSFDEPRFTYFVRNLLNNLDESKSQTWAGNYIPESFRNAIKTYKRIGQYTAKDNGTSRLRGNVLDVLIVNVKRDITLERARTLQRNFIARHLKQRNHEAALVAFYTEGYDDWRFSLVKMDFNLNKTRVEIELSPAKRYSFLVGENERSHTAQSQFQKILTEIPNPSLNDLEQAFNIETVTREFFLEYRNLFIHTKLELDKVLKDDPKLKLEFESKAVNSVDFSKKLLGQIIFLYFLQKKGWFGVERDSDWGTGSKKFLRELFDLSAAASAKAEKKHGINFFNDYLEPLFYEALRMDRSHDDHYYSRFNCKIPFLNGGLFDPIGNYDWVHTDINLPNELFSNKHKTKEGDVGDGILDIFDRYNFTVIEDEPLEKEVAIDPELLGKAYEKFNAIRPDNFNEYIKVLKSGKKGEENKFNKQYGVYYTPREIVHYMCRESLINFLGSEFSNRTDAYQKVSTEQLDAFGNTTRKGQLALEKEYKPNPFIPKEDIETLINYGELLGENEAVVESKGKETETYYHKLPESIRKNATLIDEKLADILICDPAVGSGAFPVGMMHEIVSARNVLSIFIKDKIRTIYKFKRECIEKSLYGSDIDSGAVEIAKLRLWLSLVVDENDINNIKPLPNLDYKIVCGNSLLNYPYKPLGLDEIERLKQEFIFETNPTKKNELREKIDTAIYGLYRNSEKNLGYKVTMDFKINFSEVFHQNNGFDIIIGNPPYLESRSPDFTDKLKNEIQASLKTLWNNDSKYISRGSDLLIYFFERSLTLVSPNGWIILITQNAWLDTDYGKLFQDFLIRHTQVKKIIDSDFKHFDSKDGPNINTVITVFEGNQTNRSNAINFINYSISNNYFEVPSATKLYSYEDNFLEQYKWGILLKSKKPILDILRNINSFGKRLDELTHLKLSPGQGLNLSKDYFVSKDFVEENNILKEAFPILTSDDGAPFILSKTSKYLLPSSCRLSLKKKINISLFDEKSTSKKPPLFILPRGIGRHFCSYNNINSYSASFVEIYDNEGNISKPDILRFWLFFNSSLFWLIRELSGRKNLGGGMLKAEATDLKSFPLYFQFKEIEIIGKLFNHLSDKEALSPIEEIQTQHHQQIDRIVFNYLKINLEQQTEIVESLKQQILTRSAKSKT